MKSNTQCNPTKDILSLVILCNASLLFQTNLPPLTLDKSKRVNGNFIFMNYIQLGLLKALQKIQQCEEFMQMNPPKYVMIL